MDEGTPIQFRRASRQDAASLWLVRTRAIEAIPRSCYDQPTIARWTAASMPDGFQDVITDQHVVIAEHDARIVGWGFFDKDTAQIEAAFVDPDFQRRGVGSQILATLEDIAREAGLASLKLLSTLNAVPFYEQAGFERRGPTKYQHRSGFELDCVVMVKELDGSAPSADRP